MLTMVEGVTGMGSGHMRGLIRAALHGNEYLALSCASQDFFDPPVLSFFKTLGLPLSLKMMLLFLHLLQRKGRVQ